MTEIEAAQAERDEEHGWAVIATERARRAEAERDALQALVSDLAANAEEEGHGGGYVYLDPDLLARLDAAAEAEQ
jgi:hypothetical protein